MTRKVPSISPGADARAIETMAKVVKYITAQEAVAIQPLSTSATTAQIIAKINEIIARLQGS